MSEFNPWKARFCPVTRKPIITREIWSSKNPTYSVTFFLVGNDVILSRGQGRSDKGGLDRYLTTFERMLDDLGAQVDSYYLIEDLSEMVDSSSENRKGYGRYMSANKRLKGIFFTNSTQKFRIMINLGKATFAVKFPVSVAKDYEDAINSIQQIESKGLRDTAQPIIKSEQRNVKDYLAQGPPRIGAHAD